MNRPVTVVLLAALAAGAAAAPVQAAEPKPLGLACAPRDGVRFCPAETAAQRVPSWDGVPIDVDVTLPATGDGPWPTIALHNGLGGHKRQLEPTAPSPGNGRGPKIFPNTDSYNNVFYARRGYAVLALSTRGFGESCGAGGIPAAQTQPPPCDRGFVRIADQRYEIRDTQHLLGLLVDEGIAKAGALGATGFSYGGGISLALGYLYDRIRMPDGTLVAWRSPKGTPLATNAVYAKWLWSDLIASLLPNGRFLDFDPATNDDSLEPLGVEIQSYTNGLFGLAQLDGYVIAPQPPGSPDEPWDLTTAIAKLGAGEPYGEDVLRIAREYREFHGGFGLPPHRHAALLLQSGWADDVFPVSEALRAYNDVRSRDPRADVALLLGDYGHGRAGNKKIASTAFNEAGAAFFDEHLRGSGEGPAPGSVLAYTTTCPTGPTGPPDGGPLRASSWAAIHKARLALVGDGTQTVRSDGGDPLVGYNFDPIPNTNPLGTSEPCKAIAETTAAGTANLRRALDAPFTMLGRPTIRARVTSTGTGGMLAGRLWDVMPNGQQRLVTRGVYRLTDGQTGEVVFQLNGNGYTFEKGHEIKLELAPSDAPHFRASNGRFTATLEGLRAELPQATPEAVPVRCRTSVRIVLPRARRRVSIVITRASGHRVRTVRGRALRARTVVVRGLPPGRRLRLRFRVRVRTAGGGTRLLRAQTRVVRVPACG